MAFVNEYVSDVDAKAYDLESSSTGNYRTKSTSTWRLTALELLPRHEGQRGEIVALLKEALTAYKASGIGVPVADHTTFFEF